MNFFRVLLRRVIDLLPELVIVALVVAGARLSSGPDPRIVADGHGYYDYLPSIFIRGDFVRKDLSVEQSQQLYPAVWSDGTYVTVDDKRVNKYFSGVAVLLTPFFLVASLFSEAGDNGYSALFEITVLIGALFYLFLGLLFLRRLLLLYAVPRWSIVLTQACIAIGTSLFFYTTVHCTFSHVYSFFAVTAFFFFAKKYFLGTQRKDLLWACTFFGLVLLLRPVNILTLAALPFIAGTRTDFMNALKSAVKQWRTLLAGLGLTGLIYALQPVALYAQTGQFFIDTYPGEHFNFLEPHTFDFLFGFRKGLFVYAPVLLLCIPGILVMGRRVSWWAAGCLAGFIFIVSYVLSSWHDPVYGATFGNRVLVDYYALMAIPIALLFGVVRWWWNAVMLVFVLCCIPLSVFQVWQYNYFYLHWTDMNYEKYKLVFLEYSPQYRGILWKPQVYREWNLVDTGESPRDEVAPFTMDTIYDTTFTAEHFVQPSLVMVGFDYDRDFFDTDPSVVDVTAIDSASGEIWYFRTSFVFHFQESDSSRHGHCVYDIPARAVQGSQRVLVRVVTRDTAVAWNNRGVYFYRWKE